MKDILFMKRTGITTVVTIIIIITTFIFVCSIKKSSSSIESNVEALAEIETGSGFGHHLEQCGVLVIEWNGQTTNCNKMITECDHRNNNGCTPVGCPIHGLQ